MNDFKKIKWLILLAGIIAVICLFWISSRQQKAEPYYDKTVVYKEEIGDLFQMVNLEQLEVEALLMPMVSQILTWEDTYYIYDALGYKDVITDRSSQVLTEEISRKDFLEIYQRFLEMVQTESEVVAFVFWGHVPEENRIITDQGNFNTTLPKDFFSYGGTYEAVCTENTILLVQSEKKPVFKPLNVVGTDGTAKSCTGNADPQDVSLPSTVRVVLTNDNHQEALRSTFQIKCTGNFSISCGDMEKTFGSNTVLSPEAIDGIWGEQAVVTLRPENNQSIYVLEADTGQWSAAYRGILLIYKKGNQFWLVNHVPLEEYLLGVVPGEMPERFELEALKAQAVCARTYVCNKISGEEYEQYGADVDDSVNCQVYNKHGENEKAAQAVSETAGVVLLENRETNGDFQSLDLADIYYFSTSCGFTTGLEAWGQESSPCLKTVSTLLSGETVTDWDAFLRRNDVSAYDSGSNYFRWKAEVTIPAGYTLKIDKRETSGIVTRISYSVNGEQKYVETENEIRRNLGCYVTKMTDINGADIRMDMLPSAWFSLEQSADPDKYILYGGGYGHGIGMSQYGAHGMAQQGWTYDEILMYFYSGAVLNR